VKAKSSAARCRVVLIVGIVVLSLASCRGMNGFSGVSAARYPYLPDSMNEDVDLSVAEFAAVRLTAYYNCPGNLTAKLMRQSARCFLGPDSVDLFVDTVTQASWDVHVAGARFSVSDDQVVRAYAEAGDIAMDWLRRFFPGVDEAHMRVIFSIKGYQIGVYNSGQFVIAR